MFDFFENTKNKIEAITAAATGQEILKGVIDKVDNLIENHIDTSALSASAKEKFNTAADAVEDFANKVVDKIK